jgi:aryl-alcohol dehydrogenase-like predicted oxidoreductase
MQYRKLGNSGLYVSEISYGTWGVNEWMSEDNLVSCIKTALDLGITTFDTADVYGGGSAESLLGTVLGTKKRSNYEISTKSFFNTGSGPNGSGLSRKHIIDSVNSSLKRLKTDYIDIYIAHRYDNLTPIEETLDTYQYLINAGKVLYIGVSEWTTEEISNAVEYQKKLAYSKFITSQVRYSGLARYAENSLIPLCKELGISQMAVSPLAQGILSGKYPTSAQDVRGNSTNYLNNILNERTIDSVLKLHELSKSIDKTTAQMMVSWVLSNSNISTAVVGARTPEQLAEIATNIESIDHSMVEKINNILSDVSDTSEETLLNSSPINRLAKR